MSPRTSKQNSRIRDERREQILHAALKVFARCGFAAARMTDIAAEAGISTGLAYHYFASKEDLFHELVALALNTSLNVYEQAHASKGSAWERLVRIVNNVVPAAYKGVGSLFFLIMIQSQTYQYVPQVTRDLIARRVPGYNAILVDLIERAQAEGSAREGDPAAFANAINGIIQGLAVLNASSTRAQMPDPATILRMVQV